MSTTRNLLQSLIIIFFIILNISCGSTRNTIAIEEGWEIIGESNVNFVRDRDEINVVSSNRFSTIRFKVEKKDILIKDLNIVYQSGDKLSPLIDEELNTDQYSKEIDLGAEGKLIRSIDFNYRSKGNMLKGRAKVLVFGKRAVQLYYPVPATAPVQQ